MSDAEKHKTRVPSSDQMIDSILAFDFMDLDIDALAKDGKCYKCDGSLDIDSSQVVLEFMRKLFFYGDEEPNSWLRRSNWKLSLKPNKLKEWQLELRPEISGAESSSYILRGDTLIAYRAMACRWKKSISHEELKKIADDEGKPILDFCSDDKLINDHRLASFFLLPVNSRKEGRELNLNQERGLHLSDNPFCFFSILREAFECEDENERRGWVKQHRYSRLRGTIMSTWWFWGLFGSGTDGFDAFIDRFCLEPVLDHPRFEEYCDFGTVRRECVPDYIRAVHELRMERENLMKERLKKMDNNALEELYELIFPAYRA